ncbi:MAG: hypothetical protein ACT4P1_11280 [Sporichthyaceae bacterium]
MVAEASQEKGRVGVYEVKAWLEATTYFAISWDVYEFTEQCTRKRLDGQLKRYDLAGRLIGPRQVPVFVEAKAYDVVGSQGKDFKEFLVNAYSTTAHEIEEKGGDPGTEFLWVTTHPFSQGEWPKLTSRQYLEASIKEALKANVDCLAGKPLDPDLVIAVAQRLWLLVRHERQNEVSLTKDELFKIYSQLGRYP